MTIGDPPIRTEATLGGPAPLYLQVAKLLESRIQTGQYPVGTLLPTEMDLAADLHVSRQTIRQAIQQLRNQRLLSATKGVGTRVEHRQATGGYHFSLQSLGEIFQYASETTFEVIEEEDIAARGKLATELGCRPGRSFVHLGGLRRALNEELPLGWVDVWVDGRYGAVVKGVPVHRSAIFSLIERQSGEAIVEVTQEINAITLPEKLAEPLKAIAGEAALQVMRRYFGTGRRLVEMSISVFPGARFGYSMTLRRT